MRLSILAARFAAPCAAAALALSVAAVAPASAGEQKPYSAAALKAAQDAGKPVVVDVVASWCPTCAAQKPAVKALMNDPKYKDFVLFDVDFDKEKPTLRKLNVQQQSTIIVYKGTKERARSTGETEKEAIRQLFDTAS